MNTNRIRKLLVSALLILIVISLTTVAVAQYATIPFGEESQRVRSMQTALKNKGFYKGFVDGKFGAGTKSAIKKYQASIGLHADGRPGNKTLTALYNGASAVNTPTAAQARTLAKPKSANTLAYGMVNARVRSLQRALTVLGFYKGSIDGQYGDMTMASVKAFQRSVGLHADGMAGTRTLNSLNEKQSKVHVGTTTLLSTGSQGAMVSALQAELTALGYTIGDASGLYGADTRAAVLAYQKANQLEETGTVSESLYNKITVKVPVRTTYATLQPGTSSASVGTMKAKLISLKLLDAANTSNDYDAATVTAVRAFQSNYGLKVDGVAGNKTLTKLYQLVP